MGDLERGIRYMLSREISTTDMLDELRLNTIYNLLESLVRYLPLRQPLRNFLVILRDWPVIMEYKALSGAQYKQKVGSSSISISTLKTIQFLLVLGRNSPINVVSVSTSSFCIDLLLLR